jgi:hypothetical protein
VQPQAPTRVCEPDNVLRPAVDFLISFASSGASAPKLRRITDKGILDRESVSFDTHWRASRALKGQPAPPPVSAAHRLQAFRERVLAKRGSCSGDAA